MNIKRDIISSRFLNDGISLVNLNEVRKKYLKLFLNDRRLKYKTISQCPLCQNENSILIAEKGRNGIPLETVVCENCGLIRSYKRLDEESSRLFYFEYYRKIYEYESFTDLDADLLEKRYEERAKLKIPKYVTKDKVILDMGCGGGWSLMPFYKRGYRHYGFDFDKDFVEYGKRKGLNLYLGGVEEAVKMGVKCDYLLIDQVFEHITDPINFLISLKPLLKDKAIANIYVPSLDLLLWGYADYDLLGTLQNAHNFLYDEFTLRAIGDRAGFEIINCLANNLVLRNSQNTANPIPNISKLKRGRKIVKYLKFVEKIYDLKKKIGVEKTPSKRLYCILRPIGCWKRFSMNHLGKI